MARSSAERQRKHRDKLITKEPEKYEENKRKHAEYMRKVFKPIGQLSEINKKKRRKQWREASETLNNKTKQKKEEKQPTLAVYEKKYRALLKRVVNMKEVIENLTQQNKTLKKTVYRQRIKIRKLNKISVPLKTDNTEKKTLLYNAESFLDDITDIPLSERERVKRKVLENNVLSEALAHVYKTSDNIKSKNVLKSIASNDIVRKYKMTTEVSQKLGLKGRIRKKKNTRRATRNEIQKIKSFFTRDDVSRATAGKKDCLTSKKLKQQKRFLSNTMLTLHSKYKAEGGKASYTTFVRHKPFYVVHPKLSSRDTCACIRHSNLAFKAEKLKKLNLIKTSNLEVLVGQVTCDVKSNTCMHLNCSSCKNKRPEIAETPKDTECVWLQWVRKDHQYMKKYKDGTSKLIKTKKYAKVTITSTTGELIQQFQKDLQLFKKHFFNIQHQYFCYREAVENMGTEEACVIVDFSENFSCKMTEEIQAMHFGPSRAQVTLHTGVIYKKNTKPESFASISPNNDHDPGAIWAHLEVVFKYLLQKYPEIKIIHMFSDGPSTQYKQKKAFFVFDSIIQEHNLHFGTWSYFEASHGKGAADGVGGTLKRTLDQQIAFGRDVCNARNTYDILSETTNVKLFYVTEDAIKSKQDMIPQDLIAIKGTMQIHQIICKSGQLKYRNLSCFCGPIRGLCTCFELKQHNLRALPYDLTQSPIPGPSKVFTSLKTSKKIQANVKSKSLSDSDASIDSHVPYAETDDIMLEEMLIDRLEADRYGMIDEKKSDEEKEQKEVTKKAKGKGKKTVNRNQKTSDNDVIEKENKNPTRSSQVIAVEILLSSQADKLGVSEKRKVKRKRGILKPISKDNIMPKKIMKRNASYSSSINDSDTTYFEDDTSSLNNVKHNVDKIEAEIWNETLRLHLEDCDKNTSYKAKTNMTKDENDLCFEKTDSKRESKESENGNIKTYIMENTVQTRSMKKKRYATRK